MSDTKRCPKCATTKPVTDFYRNKARKDGVGVYCADCQTSVDDERERRQRAELAAIFGGRCGRCGYDGDPRAFQIDHVDGGGTTERRGGLFSYPAALLRRIREEPGKYQLLCANCNIIKKFEQGETVGSRVYLRTAPPTASLLSGEFTEKYCPKCMTVKPTTEFNASRKRCDGLSGWCAACYRVVNAETARRQRGDLLAALGGRCQTCGFDNPVALQVDHVNGDGAEQRRSMTNMHARTLLKLVLADPAAYQLLCANCNVIKRIENREHCGRRQYKRTVLTTRTLVGRAHLGVARTAAADARLAELLAEVERRRPVERSTVRLPQGSWSRFYERCLGCQRTDRRHAADGLCFACNGRAKGYTRRIPQTT